MSEEEEISLISLFTETLIATIKKFMYPIFYKTLVYFFSPAVGTQFIDQQKEQIILLIY